MPAKKIASKPAKAEEKPKQDWFGLGSDEEDAGGASDEEEEESRGKATKRRKLSDDEVSGDDASDFGSDEEGYLSGDADSDTELSKPKGKYEESGLAPLEDDDLTITDGPRKRGKSKKLAGLSSEDLEKARLARKKSGVVYMSRIPPFMKPQKVKHLLQKFGPIGRIFLAPEDPKSYAKRVRFGGNKKRNFTEGWIEFKDKKVAKTVAETLNATGIGGKKGSYYHDDLWNLKYLPKFKWDHLTEQIAYENASRQSRLRAEIQQATRENKTFIQNVERGKMVANMEAKKGAKRKREDGAGEKGEGAEIDVRRTFRQRELTDKTKPIKEGEGREKVERVLSKIF
ncbi:RNA-binding ATPase activator esf2 [Saitoella coloradoensis]